MYQVGDTITLTGDEKHWEQGQSLRDRHGILRDFPWTGTIVEIDSDGDVVVENSNKETCTFSPEKTPDMVSHPPHYNSGLPEGVEVIDIIRTQAAGLPGTQAVFHGNVVKYILRWQFKNGVEDLKKAHTYLSWLIEEVE